VQILGAAFLTLLAGMVFCGVKHITKIAPFFLVPVVLSVLFIQVGIYSASDDGRGGKLGSGLKGQRAKGRSVSVSTQSRPPGLQEPILLYWD
jgi:hypothetical protein